jgi:hypothetical protein
MFVSNFMLSMISPNNTTLPSTTSVNLHLRLSLYSLSTFGHKLHRSFSDDHKDVYHQESFAGRKEIFIMPSL